MASCKVEELNISICKEIEDTAMQEILSQSLLRNSLQCLHINGLPLEQESLDMAATLQHLTTLSLCGIASLNDSNFDSCLLYTSPSPRDRQKSRMPSSA